MGLVPLLVILCIVLMEALRMCFCHEYEAGVYEGVYCFMHNTMLHRAGCRCPMVFTRTPGVCLRLSGGGGGQSDGGKPQTHCL